MAKKKMYRRIFNRRIIVSAACILLALILIIFAFSYYTVRQFVYCKSPTPDQLTYNSKKYCQLMSLGAQDIHLTTKDGIQLTGLFIERQHAKRAVILCHGYRMSKERMTRIATMFPDDSLLLFDFRGHGCSTGEVVSLGCHEVTDIFAAIDFLHNNTQTADLPIIGIGVSMGGASLIAAAAQGAPFEALIVDSAFAQLQNQIAHRFTTSTGLPTVPFMTPTIWLFEYITGCAVNTINPAQALKNVHCPVLFIHSMDDDFTLVHNARQLYATASEPKELWIVPHAKHGYIAKEYDAQYRERIHQFLEQFGL